MFAAETYLSLLRDPAHWMLELTIEAVTGVVLYPAGRLLARRWVRRHDQKEHPVKP